MNTPERQLKLPRRGMLTTLASSAVSIGMLAARLRHVQAESAIPDIETYQSVAEAVGQEEMEKFPDVEAKFASRGVRTKILLWSGALPYPETQRSKDTKVLRYISEGLVAEIPGEIQLAEDALVVWISNVKDPAKHNMKPREIFQVDAGTKLHWLLNGDGFDGEAIPSMDHLWNRISLYQNAETGLRQSHMVEALQKIWNLWEEKRQVPSPSLDTVKNSELARYPELIEQLTREVQTALATKTPSPTETPAPVPLQVVEQPREIDPRVVGALATAIAVPWTAIDIIRSSPVLSAATVFGAYELAARRWFPQMRLKRAFEILREFAGELVRKNASRKDRQPIMVFESKDPNAIYERRFFGPMWARTQKIFDDGMVEIGEKIDHFIAMHQEIQRLNQASLNRSVSREVIASVASPSVLGVLAMLKLRADRVVRSGTQVLRNAIPSAVESDAFASDLQEKLLSMFVPAVVAIEQPVASMSRAKMLELQKQTTKLRRLFVARCKRMDEARSQGRLKAIVPDGREVAWTRAIFDGMEAIDKARAALQAKDLDTFQGHLTYAQMIHHNLNAESYLHQQKISQAEIARLDAEREDYRRQQEKIRAQNESMAKLLEEHGVRQKDITERSQAMKKKLFQLPSFNGYDEEIARMSLDLDIAYTCARDATLNDGRLPLAAGVIAEAEEVVRKVQEEHAQLLERTQSAQQESRRMSNVLSSQIAAVHYPDGTVFGYLNEKDMSNDASIGVELGMMLTGLADIVEILDLPKEQASNILQKIHHATASVSNARRVAQRIAESPNAVHPKFGGDKKWVVETLMYGVQTARLVEAAIRAKLLVHSEYVADPTRSFADHSNGYHSTRTNGHASSFDTQDLPLRQRTFQPLVSNPV